MILRSGTTRCFDFLGEDDESHRERRRGCLCRCDDHYNDCSTHSATDDPDTTSLCVSSWTGL